MEGGRGGAGPPGFLLASSRLPPRFLRARCFPSAPPSRLRSPESQRCPAAVVPVRSRPRPRALSSPVPPLAHHHAARLEFDRPRGNGKRLAQPPPLSLLSRHASLKLELSSSGTPRCLRRPPLRRGFAPRSHPPNSSFPRIHRVVFSRPARSYRTYYDYVSYSISPRQDTLFDPAKAPRFRL